MQLKVATYARYLFGGFGNVETKAYPVVPAHTHKTHIFLRAPYQYRDWIPVRIGNTILT